MMRGACLCAAVEFEIDTDEDYIYVCHCSICRRSTGVNGVAVVLVDKVAFRWTRGEEHIVTWTKPGSDWQTWFCPTCGSPLPGHNDAERMFVPAGLITEGGDRLRVGDHIWVNSKAAWDEIGDSGRRHPEHYS